MSRRFGTTRTRGLGSARVCSIAPGAVLVVALAGCSSGQSTLGEPAVNQAHEADASPASPADQPSGPPAFHFASGDLVLGDFTYEDVAGNIFNPCEEISAEEFAAIGFETDGGGHRMHSKDLNACFLDAQEINDEARYAVMGGSANQSTAEAQAGIIEADVSALVPNVYIYGPTGVDADICYAAVDTLRGQLSVGVGEATSNTSFMEHCDKAIKVIEAFSRL